MKTRGKGRIVFIASGAGLRTSLTGIQAYASAKAGEIGLARQLGQEGPAGSRPRYDLCGSSSTARCGDGTWRSQPANGD